MTNVQQHKGMPESSTHGLWGNFADEERTSRREYSVGYTPKSIGEQIKRLRELFPEIGHADEKLAKGTLPQNAEGWFAIPRWEKIAPSYDEVVPKVLGLIHQTRNSKFLNYREGQLGPKHLRQTVRTADFWERICNEQKGNDILIVPAQFGLRHRGRSVRRAREVFSEQEFGLGAFDVGIMMLTHPDRLNNEGDLWIDCAGDEYAPLADDAFTQAPFFHFLENMLKFGVGHFFYAFATGGSVSGFT